MERRRAGTWGDVGIWSFAATKTISTGEGGMLVSRHPDAIELARAFRNYGKPDYALHGLNFRLNEFTAALGIVQTGVSTRSSAGRTTRRGRTSIRCTPRVCSCRTA